MRHSGSSPLILAVWAVAMAAATSAAPASVWLPHGGQGLHWADADWSPSWRQDGRSYVDDGFRAPIDRSKRSPAQHAVARASSDTLERMFDQRANGQGRSGSPAFRTGSAAPGNGPGAFAGFGFGSGSGAGRDTRSLQAAGILPAPTASAPTVRTGGPRDGDGRHDGRDFADLILPAIGSSDPSDTGSPADALPITPVPAPASAILLIAGLGGFVLVMRRRPGRTG